MTEKELLKVLERLHNPEGYEICKEHGKEHLAICIYCWDTVYCDACYALRTPCYCHPIYDE